MNAKHTDYAIPSRAPETLDQETLLGLFYDMQKENKKLARQVRRLQDALNKAEAIALTASTLDVLRTAEQKKREKYMQLLLENGPDSILILNEEGRIVLCTATFLKLARLDSFNRINGRTFQEVYHILGEPEFIGKALEHFEPLGKDNQGIEIHTKIRFPGWEEPRDYTIQITPIGDEAGTFDGTILVYHDATELLQAEAIERTCIMLDATPMVCCFWNQEGLLIDCNHAVLDIFGLSKKQDFTEHFFDLTPEFQADGISTRDKVSSLIAKTLETGYQKFEWMFLTSTGEPLPTETILVRVPWKEGHRIAAYSRDLREIKAKEAQAKEADEQRREMEIQTLAAQAASEAKSQFLASLSHELCTPLNAIIGMSDLMPTTNLDTTQRSYFEDIKKMSKVLLQLINDILDLSKIEAGKLELRQVHFNLMELYDHICSMSCFTAEAKHLEFRYTWGADLPGVLYGDPIRIYQMLTNLINNAIKYTKTGYVDFKVYRTEKNNQQYMAFRVKDTGIGIKQENFSRLFKRFERFDREINRDVLGSGLGLQITKNLADMMGAEIDVESEYGVGSIFTILLPLTEGDPGQVARSSPVPRMTFTDDVQILVVDDHQINLKVTLAFLSSWGIKGDTAQSGEEAIQRVQKKHYDIIFMDHIMPEMDGIETTRRIRALEGPGHTRTPIIALTAHKAGDTRSFLVHSGMNDFLAKPINREELNRILRKWLPRIKISIPPEGLPQDTAAVPDLPMNSDALAGESQNRKQIHSLVERLAPLLEAGNAESFDLCGEIRESLGEPGEALIKEIEDFEFERALQTLLSITKGLP